MVSLYYACSSLSAVHMVHSRPLWASQQFSSRWWWWLSLLGGVTCQILSRHPTFDILKGRVEREIAELFRAPT